MIHNSLTLKLLHCIVVCMSIAYCNLCTHVSIRFHLLNFEYLVIFICVHLLCWHTDNFTGTDVIDSIKFQLIICKHAKFYTNLTSFVHNYIFTAISKYLDDTENFQADTNWFRSKYSKQSLIKIPDILVIFYSSFILGGLSRC